MGADSAYGELGLFIWATYIWVPPPFRLILGKE